MKLLVTGANGMLGSDVVKVAKARGHNLVSFGRQELDITNLAQTLEKVRDALPDVVVNCAAYTDVDGAESDIKQAEAINAVGAENVASAAASVGASIVHISTDYVYDGEKASPYTESDSTGPKSAYGLSKLDGELAVARVNSNHCIVRTAWLFGKNGKNFVTTMMGLAKQHDSVQVVTDQIGCPTYTGHLAEAIVSLAESASDPTTKIRNGNAAASPFGIHHVVADGQCSWFEFAQEIFKSSGTQCTVKPTTSESFPRPAKRPAYSVLRSERPDSAVLPTWQEGLTAYLKEIERT